MDQNNKKIDWDFYEYIIIYNLLTDETYLASVIEHINKKYFTNKEIGTVIDVLSSFYTEHQQIPSTTELKAYLVDDKQKQDFKTVVSTFDELDRVYNKDELYNNTETFLRERAVYNTLLDIVDECTNKNNVDTSHILKEFEQSCNITLTTDLGLDYFSDIERHISDLTTSEPTIPSTWEWLDNKLDGGFLQNGKALYIFAGETNIGKSIFLGNLATNICQQNKTVLLVSLEMSELIYARRISSDITQIPINELSHRVDDLRDRVGDFQQKNNKSRLLIKEYPPSTITCNHLKSFVKKITDQGIVLDAIVLDYVNLLKSSISSNSYERIKDSTEQIRALSYICNCPVITATQLNRSGYDEINPGLDTISESIGLAATADAIFSLWQEEEDAELGVIKLGVMKNRFGPNFGSTSMRVDYNTLSVYEDNSMATDDDINDVTASLSFLSD